MVHYSRVIKGLVDYVDNDIISLFNGSMRAWGIGIAAGILAKRSEQIFVELKQNPALTSLGLIDGDMVDIEAIYSEALRMAQKGSATVNIPLIGPTTFKTADVENIYRYIMGA